MTILIVDDNQAIREVLVEILEDEGYPAVTVTNGEEALAFLEQHPSGVRLIVLDLTMPKLSGWGFLQARRSRPDLLTIPVLVLSAYPGTAATVIGGPRVSYLAKPWDSTTLRREIERLYTAS
jgi:CheY-like chemotaxis protein